MLPWTWTRDLLIAKGRDQATRVLHANSLNHLAFLAVGLATEARLALT